MAQVRKKINGRLHLVERHPSSAIKTEVRVTSSSNNWTKTLDQDNYLYCIANFCGALLNISSKQVIFSNTNRRQRMLNFVWNTRKFWWNETDDEILPVFPQNLWTLKFIFARSRGKLFSLLFQTIIYLALRKCKNDCKILKITLVQIFVH